MDSESNTFSNQPVTWGYKRTVLMFAFFILAGLCSGVIVYEFQDFIKGILTRQSIRAVRMKVAVPLVLGKIPYIMGKQSAAFTLVEFGDYQCPACYKQHKSVIALLDKYSDKLRFVFRHFPLLHIHPNAFAAAQLVESARSQGKFWRVHNALFEAKGKINTTMLSEIRAENGIQPARSASAAGEVNSRIEYDIKAAGNIGLQFTPTFLLCCPNGEVLKLSGPLDAPQIIDAYRGVHQSHDKRL